MVNAVGRVISLKLHSSVEAGIPRNQNLGLSIDQRSRPRGCVRKLFLNVRMANP